MDKRKLQRKISRMVYDKKICNRTLLRYYKSAKEAAEVLEGKKKEEKGKKKNK